MNFLEYPTKLKKCCIWHLVIGRGLCSCVGTLSGGRRHSLLPIRLPKYQKSQNPHAAP